MAVPRVTLDFVVFDAFSFIAVWNLWIFWVFVADVT
jgi:hypothetical protein